MCFLCQGSPFLADDPMLSRLVASATSQSPLIAPEGAALGFSPTDGTATASIVDPGIQNIRALIYGTKWVNGVVTYDFPDVVGDYGAYAFSIGSFAQVGLWQRTATRQILEGAAGVANKTTAGPVWSYGSFESVAGLVITDQGQANAADISVGQATSLGGATIGTARVASFPRTDNRSDGGDVWYGTQYNFSQPRPGDYFWLTHIHEYGHALGLKHGHDPGPGYPANFGNVALTADRDSLEFSVMTYRSYIGASTTDGYTNETYGYPTTPMMLDIQALQYLYGANFTTNGGNTTYSFSPTTGEMFINGVGQGAPGLGTGGASNRVFLTIWDGGGIDTYDFSNYTTNQSISLQPGGWSLMSNVQQANLGFGNMARGNVFNALQYNSDPRSLIENANGGSGSDVIVGNNTNNVLQGNAGQDTLYGEGGDDLLIGGEGDDVLYGGDGQDSLYGGNGNDVIIDTSGLSSVLDGGAGNDTIYGGPGSDYMIGGDGNDVIVGLGGANSMYGGGGADYMVSGDGAGSVIDGGSGANTLWGGSGNDYVIGGELADVIVTGGGSDYIFANAGNDTIYAGGGTDFIFTNEGNDFIYTDDIGFSAKDYIYAGRGTGIDTVADFTISGANADVVVISGGLFTSFGQVSAAMTQIGVYTVINVTNTGDQLYLYNVQPFQLTANNFILL